MPYPRGIHIRKKQKLIISFKNLEYVESQSPKNLKYAKPQSFKQFKNKK